MSTITVYAPSTPMADARRITEADPDFVRLREATVRRLSASVRALVRDLRERPDAEHLAVQSAFIQRHIALLRDAYAAGHAEGARDYYDTVSLQPARWARRLAPAVDERRLRERLGFYAPSVAKLAHEARMAWQQSVAQQMATQAARRAERAEKLAEGQRSGRNWSDGVTGRSDTYLCSTDVLTDADLERGMRVLQLASNDLPASTDPLDQWVVSVQGRIGLQAEIAWPGLMDGYVRAGVMDPAAPFSLVWWVLGAVETRHCADCPRYAANGPYNAPGSGGNELRATPGDGTTECGAGCKCTLEYVPGGAIEHTVWSVLVPQIEERLASGVATTGGVPEADLVRGPDGTVIGWLVRDASGQVVARMAGNPADLEREEAEGQRLPPGEAERRASAWGEITDTMARLRGVDIQPPASNRLDDAEKAALDRYRAATDRWERARVGSPLPELPPLFADLHEIDPTGILSGTVAWEQLTAEQQAALQDVWQALAAWVEAEGDAGVGGHDVAGDPWAESGATGMFSDGEQGTYLLTGGHPKGYEQNRTRDGKFAPGDGGTSGDAKGRERMRGAAHSVAAAIGRAFGRGTGERERGRVGVSARDRATHAGVGRLGEGAQVAWGEHRAGAQEAFRTLLGRELADHELASLVGARPGDTVTIERVYSGAREVGSPLAHYRSVTLRLDGKGGAYTADRVLSTAYDRTGMHPQGVEMGNASFYVHGAGTGKGVGTEVFSRQVAALGALGVRQIRTRADKAGVWWPDRGFQGAHNGFYTWARLGYDATLKDIGEYYGFGTLVRGTPELRGARTVRDILRTPVVTDIEHGHERVTGTQWWLRHGVGFDGTFDLTPGSRSIQTLEAYLHEKGKAMPSAQLAELTLPHQGARVGDALEWTGEDEAAADRAWATLIRRWNAEDEAAAGVDGDEVAAGMARYLAERGWTVIEPGDTGMVFGGHGYNPYRDSKGRFAPGPHAPEVSHHAGQARTATVAGHAVVAATVTEGHPGMRAHLERKFGRPLADGEIAGLAGAHAAGSSVTLERGGAIIMRHGDYEHRTHLLLGSEEDPHMRLMVYTRRAGTDKPMPFDARSVATQVAAAHRLGIERLSAKCDSQADDSTRLPRLGFNAAIDAHFRAEMPGKQWPPVAGHTLLEVLAKPEGAAWWREMHAAGHNLTLGLSFDTTPGSKSVQALGAYLREHPAE